MRFSTLHLIKYGHFDTQEMQFPAAGPLDFQLIYGPNEAGKSTTMAAITSLLFGFPAKDKYDFRSNRLLMRVGAEIENESGKLQCRRRATNALLDFDEHPIDDALLANMLGGQKADGFNRMFSLNHIGLREGGQAILAARDDVGQAIFAAGSGLSSVASLLANLDERSKDIWAPTKAAARSYYAAKEKYDDGTSRLRAAQTKPDTWEKLRQRAETLGDDILVVRERRRILSALRMDIERQRRTLPRAADRKAIIDALASLADVPRLPSDTKTRLDVIEADLLRHDTELRIATAQAEQAQIAIEALVINEALLERLSDFDLLRERKGAVEKGEEDAPGLRSKAEMCNSRLGPLLRDIGWPIEDIPQVEARLPSRIIQVQVEELLSRIGTNETVIKAARDTEANRKKDAEKLREEDDPSIQTLPFEAIKAQVKVAIEKGDVDDGVARAARALQGKQKILQTALSKLVPWTGSIENLECLVVPTAEQTRHAGQVIDNAQSAIGVLKAGLAEKAKKIREQEFERDQLLTNSKAVASERVAAARSDRDGVWITLREHLLGEIPIPDPAPEVSRYDELISVADILADNRFDGASESAKLALQVQSLERLKFEEKAQDAELKAAAVVLSDAQQAWQNTLASTGLTIGTGEYLTWLANRKEALAAAVPVREALDALAEANANREEARSALTSALSAAEVICLPDAPTAALRELADEFMRDFEDKRKGRLLKQGQLLVADAAVKQAKEDLSAAEEDQRALAAEFANVPQLLGFEEKTSPETVRLRSKLFGEIRSLVDEINGYEQRITGVDTDTKAFDAYVGELAQTVGFEGSHDEAPAALAVRMMAAAKAVQVQQQARVGFQNQHKKAEEDKSAAQAKIDAKTDALAPILAAAGAENAEALRLVLERAQARDKLEADLVKIEKDLLTAEPGRTLEALLAEVGETETEALVQKLSEIEAELTEIEAKIESITGQHATAKAEFDKLNDRPDAILAASDQAQALAEMEAQAEAYVGLRAEVAILRYAIERYRKEKQGPLLRRASELFSKLTLGGYAQLLVDPNAQKPRLCGVRVGTEEVVGIEGMSEGTVDQLYLSLRLAAVENIVAGGLKMPFLADDLFINYDDDRSRAGFQALGELARHTQVLFFTHHTHLLDIAQAALAPAQVSVSRLGL